MIPNIQGHPQLGKAEMGKSRFRQLKVISEVDLHNKFL